jgi:hypothetical protein
MPVLTSADLTLLHTLETGSWHDRKAAEAELTARGEGSEPLVRAMLAQTTKPEARTRLNVVLAFWAEEKLLGPSLITMHVKNAPARSAYVELFRQAGATFTVSPENLFDTVGPVSVDADRQPFWVVMQQLEHLTNVGFERLPDGTCQLVRGDVIVPGPQVIDGQFLIVAALAERCTLPPFVPGAGKIFLINLKIYPEPRTHFLPTPPTVKLDRATDNHGNAVQESVQIQAPMSLLDIEGTPYSEFLQLGDKNPGDALSDFRATISLQVAYRTQHVDIDDVTHAGPQTFDADGLVMKFKGCTKSGSTYQVSMCCSADRHDLINEFIQAQLAHVHLLDTHGREMPSAAASMDLDQNLCSMAYVFNEQSAGGPPMVARHLVWDLPAAIRTVDLPIDFKNMNLKIKSI